MLADQCTLPQVAAFITNAELHLGITRVTALGFSGAVAVVLVVGAVCVVSVGKSRRAPALCALATCLAALLALVLLVFPPLSKPLSVGPVMKLDRDAVGLAFSGGYMNAIIDTTCALSRIDELTGGKLRDLPSTKVAVSTVSGASTSYAVWVNRRQAVPPLRRNWTVEALREWPANEPIPEGSVPFNSFFYLVSDGASEDLRELVKLRTVGCAVSGKCDTASMDSGGSEGNTTNADTKGKKGSMFKAVWNAVEEMRLRSGLRDDPGRLVNVLRRVFRCLPRDSFWSCVTEALLGISGVDHPRQMHGGTKVWWPQFAVVDPLGVPYGSQGFPDPSLANHTAGAAVQHVPGEAATIVTFSDAFTPDGRMTGGPMRGSVQTVDSDVFRSLVFSSDAVSYAAPLLQTRLSQGGLPEAADGMETRSCPLGTIEKLLGPYDCLGAARLRDAYFQRTSLVGTWADSTTSSLALATDGGFLDQTGLLALVAARARKIVFFWLSGQPFVRKPRLSFLFGEPFQDPYSCDSPFLATGPEFMQIFDRSAWPGVLDGLSRTDGTGAVVLHNVSVLANPNLGIEAYTVDKLVIFTNLGVDAADGYFDHWSEIRAATGSEAIENGFPVVPGPVSAYTAAAKCIATQLKVDLNRGVLMDMLAPALGL